MHPDSGLDASLLGLVDLSITNISKQHLTSETGPSIVLARLADAMMHQRWILQKKLDSIQEQRTHSHHKEQHKHIVISER